MDDFCLLYLPSSYLVESDQKNNLQLQDNHNDSDVA